MKRAVVSFANGSYLPKLERMKEIVFLQKVQFSVCFGNGSIACHILPLRQQDKASIDWKLIQGQG